MQGMIKANFPSWFLGRIWEGNRIPFALGNIAGEIIDDGIKIGGLLPNPSPGLWLSLPPSQLVPNENMLGLGFIAGHDPRSNAWASAQELPGHRVEKADGWGPDFVQLLGRTHASLCTGLRQKSDDPAIEQALGSARDLLGMSLGSNTLVLARQPEGWPKLSV